MVFEHLETERLRLRPLLPGDGDEIFRYRSDPEICRYQNWEPESVAEVDEFIARMTALEPDIPGTWYQLAICERDTGRLLGDCGLRFPRRREYETEVGVSLAPEFQGRGYATEALEAVLAYLFDHLDKHRVFASADPRNHASLRLMERVGMRREAHFRESLWFKGEWADDMIYAMLQSEWHERRCRPRHHGATPGGAGH
jgi:RimJ/RimL family protein N-acetyltransferase